MPEIVLKHANYTKNALRRVRESKVVNNRLIMGNGERGTGNGERGTGNGEWGTGLDFLALEVLEDVALEEARASEERERHDVIARRRVRVAECPRFVHEHAQCLFGLRHCITVVVALDKEMVAGISSRHQREVSVPASR